MQEAERIGAQQRLSDVRMLGEQGGMGTVFTAWDPRLNRRVAVKYFSSQRPVDLERFRREMRLLGQLRNPAIVDIFESGELDGHPYFVMDFIEGESLKQMIDHGRQAQSPSPVADVARLLRPVAGGLDTLHSKGIVHRDVKPANILIPGVHNQRDYPASVLVDFGISTKAGDPTLTGSHFASPGTPAYSAPEQFHHRAGKETDQYALALVAYEMLTLEKLYDAHNSQDWESGARRVPPVPGCPQFVSQALARALARDPRARFHSCQAFIDALVGDERTRTPVSAEWTVSQRPRKHDFSGPTSSAPRELPGPVELGGAARATARAGNFRRRGARGRALGAALAVALLGAVGAGSWFAWSASGWTAEEKDIVRAFPALVSARPGQDGWLGLRCDRAQPLDTQEAVIACRGDSTAVVIADYRSEPNRDANVADGKRVTLNNGICSVETTGVDSDTLILPTGQRSEFAVLVHGDYAKQNIDSIPVCPR